MISRLLSPVLKNSPKSCLLLGPRQCGKTTLIRALEPELEINLARESVFLDYQSQPDLLESQILESGAKTIFIDEVQRVPAILNSVQAILDAPGGKRFKFYLTGSSARKLKRGHANLLPGRVFSYHLAPLSLLELQKQNTRSIQKMGTLPEIFSLDPRHQEDFLRSYAGTYLKEEIQAEALTRDLPGFSRFLKIAAAHVGGHVDFTKWASLAQIKRHSCANYYGILEDTLIVYRVDPFPSSTGKRLIQHPKYYFFDNGVLNGLLGSFHLSEDRKGMLFENLVASQIFATAFAFNIPIEVHSYRTEHGGEIDLLIHRLDSDRYYAVECKAGRNVGKTDVQYLLRFKEEFSKKNLTPLVIFDGERALKTAGISCLGLGSALELIFG